MQAIVAGKATAEETAAWNGGDPPDASGAFPSDTIDAVDAPERATRPVD